MIQIVLMTEEMTPQVAELEKLCFSDPWSLKSISSELDNPLSLWLAAVDNGRVLGYVGSQTVMDETDMMNIAVRPENRRAGIAEALIESLIRELQQKGSRQLTLEVRASNEAAQALYHKMGFEQVGRRPRYYQNPREDAMILRKEWQV